jgi:hypothetical protein
MHRLPILLLVSLLLSCSAAPEKPAAFQDKPGEAAEHYQARRQTNGADPHALYRAAREQMAAMAPLSKGTTPIGSWTFLGPGNIGGRTRVLVLDPDQPNVMYAAAVSGGVWKSVTSGARWDATGDQLANLSVNSLAMHPTQNDTLYAGTGEGFFREEQRGTGLPLRGNGIYLTRNGGASWQHLASTENENFHFVNDLVISTHDPRRIYAATRTGIWRSPDEGATWSRVLSTSVKGGCLDLAYRGDQTNDYLFASCGTFEQATIFRNTNADVSETWAPVHTETDMGRTTLAIARSQPSTMYALSATNRDGADNQGLHAVFRSDANGDPGSWRAQVRNDSADKLSTLLLTNPLAALSRECTNPASQPEIITMGWYCNTIAVDPADPERLWAAGVDLFRSDDGGRSWGLGSYWWVRDDAGQYVHADQHAIVFHPQYDGAANKTMFAANDGGVFRTDDARAAVARGPLGGCTATNTSMRWANLNTNYGATQFYWGAAFPDGRRFLGGTQDNGTILGDANIGPDRWGRVWGGDGGYVAIDPVDPNVVYAESQFGRMVKSVDAARSFRPLSMPADQYLFVTPFLIDPNDHNRIWIAGRTLWRSNLAGGNWTAASRQLTSQVTAIAVANGRADRLLLGTNDGSIYRTDSATTSTSESALTSVGPRAGFVSSIAFDPANPDLAYATYAGFGGTHVWRSLDGGATWTPLDGSGAATIPDIPVHSLAIDPTRPARLYLGTDLGMFVSNDGGATWLVENSGFAAVVTESVFIGQGAYGPAIYAFTHGRGAWRAELKAPPRRRSAP